MWIQEFLGVYKANSVPVTFIWNCGVWMTIMCRIYQGDTLSPLPFCIAFNPLRELLTKSWYRYKIRSGVAVTHLPYMDESSCRCSAVLVPAKILWRTLKFPAELDEHTYQPLKGSEREIYRCRPNDDSGNQAFICIYKYIPYRYRTLCQAS